MLISELSLPDPIESQPGEIVVVYGVDKKYVVSLAASVYSLLCHLPEHVPVLIVLVSSDLDTRTVERLRNLAEQTRHCARIEHFSFDMGELVARLPLSNLTYLSPAAYYRLFIPYILGKSTEKAIYLDADGLVRRDIRSLWAEDMAAFPLLAVRNYGTHGNEGDPTYFNSGVLVFDLPKWRDDNLSEQVLAYLLAYPERIKFADQDALNAILNGRWRALDPRWNVQCQFASHFWGFADSREAQRFLSNDAYIVHYTGPHKPWQAIVRAPGDTIFFHDLQRSGWYTKFGYRRWSTTMRVELVWSWVRRRITGVRKRVRSWKVRPA